MRIDITLPRRVVAFAVRQRGTEFLTIDLVWETAERTLRQIRQSVKRTGTLYACYLQSSSRLVCAVPERSDEQPRRFALQIKESVSKDGCSASQPWNRKMAAIRIRRSGRRTEVVQHFRACLLGTEEGHLFYHDLGLEIFLNEISICQSRICETDI